MISIENFNVRWLAIAAIATILFGHLLSSRLSRAWKRRSFSEAPPVPNIPWWDVMGISLVMELQRSLDENRMLEFIRHLLESTAATQQRRTTSVTMRLLGRQTFLTTDPKNVQAILALQFNDYGLGKDRIGSFLPMLGVGIFASDGKAWEHSRAMLRPNFVRNQLEDLSLEEHHCQNLLSAFPATTSNGWTPEFDIQPFFYKLTMDSATEFFFGESSCSLCGTDDSPETRFVNAFDRGQYFVGQRASMGPFYWLKTSQSFRADCKTVHEWTDMCVQRALERYHQKSSEKDSADPTKYVFLEELISQTQDPVELRSQLLNVLIAGRDTTAGLLSWVFYYLSRRPEYYAKLREVVLNTFGTFNSPRDISFASMKGCQPLQNLMKEILRLHPGVPFNIRQALKDSTLPRGGGQNGDQPFFVPKNSQLFYCVYLTHRDPEYWGPNANDFVPERWNDIRVGWEYLPFNGGPRICLGQMFSLTGAGYCIVRMLQRFDRLQTKDIRVPQIHVSLTAHSANGVHLMLHKAE